MMRFSLAQNHAKIAPAKGKTLFDASDNADLVAIAGHAEILAVYPHAPRAIVNLKDAIAQGAKRVRYRAVNTDVFAGKAAGIAVNVGDTGLCGTSSQQQDHRGQGKYQR